MSFHDDECLLAAVAMALGETIALVRSRGFHIDSGSIGYVPPRERPANRCHDADDDDTIDLAAIGIDWDAAVEHRPRRPPRLQQRWRRSGARSPGTIGRVSSFRARRRTRQRCRNMSGPATNG